MKKTVYWILLLLPIAYLVFFAFSVGYSVWALNLVIAQNSNEVTNKGAKALLDFHVAQYIRPAYINSRNIYQAFKDCVELDTQLIYRPRNESECSFNNLEFSTRLVHKNGVRWYDRKKSGATSEKEILVLGDSHAMGWGVDGHETFSAILEAELENVRVDNMAVSSYGLPRELMLMKRVFDKEDYDLVIIQYCDNDLREIEHYVEHNGVSYDYTIPAQSPKPQEKLIDDFYVQLATRIARFPIEGMEGPRKNDLPEPAANIARVLSDFVDVGTSPPLVIFPVNNIREYETFGEYEYLKEAVLRHVPSLAEKISVIDPLSGMTSDQRETHYFLIDGHLNALGHHYLAQALQPVIEEKIYTRDQ